MGILRVVIDRNFLYRTMVRTCTNEAASSSAACQRPHQAPLQEAQNPESELEVVMEDAESDDTAKDRLVPSELIREANTATDEEDVELVYNHTHFQRDKVRRQYFRYYPGRKIISREEPL
jgi:NACalpha-BTF3-like transcription factor